jgi:hypothetical protein
MNRTVCGVIFNVRIGKYFGLKNSVFYIRTLLTENNRFLCIFSFTVFIVNEYFTTVTKVKDLCSLPLINDLSVTHLRMIRDRRKMRQFFFQTKLVSFGRWVVFSCQVWKKTKIAHWDLSINI